MENNTSSLNGAGKKVAADPFAKYDAYEPTIKKEFTNLAPAGGHNVIPIMSSNNQTTVASNMMMMQEPSAALKKADIGGAPAKKNNYYNNVSSPHFYLSNYL